MFGEPWGSSKLYTVTRQVWTYAVNKYGKNQANNFCKISPINGNVSQYANNNTVCVHKILINIFLNISTAFNYDRITTDTINAYDQAQPAY